MDKVQSALAWMRQNGAGYKRASKQWGVSVDVLRAAKRAEEQDVEPEAEAEAEPDASEADPPDPLLGWVPATVVQAKPRPAHVIEVMAAEAAEAVKDLTPGARIVGLTAGQFSLLDIIRAVLEVTGPADVTLSTWTAGIRDAETAGWLLGSGALRSLRILTDRSFPTRQPQYCRRLVELFGEQAIVVTRTHAKFATVRNDAWSVAIRSSMNLNKNKRWEQFDIDDDPAVADLFDGFADRVAAASRPGLHGISTTEVDEAFDRVLAAERSARAQEARAVEIATREALSKLPPLERARRMMEDAQRSLEEAQASGDHSLVARLIVPLAHAEKRFSEVARLYGEERITLDEAQQWVRARVLPILTDEQLARLADALA